MGHAKTLKKSHSDFANTNPRPPQMFRIQLTTDQYSTFTGYFFGTKAFESSAICLSRFD